MPACIVKGCTNRSSVKSHRQEELEKTMKITLHAFPKCPAKRKLWLNSLGLQNSVAPKYAAVCSVHFRRRDLDRTSLVCVRLKENAVPYVKLPETTKEDNFNAREEILTEESSNSVELQHIKIEENFTECEEISNEEPSNFVELQHIKIEKNFTECEETSNEEPSNFVELQHIKIEENFTEREETSNEEPSTSMSSAVIKIEVDDSVESEPESMTGRKERHLEIESVSDNEQVSELLETADKSTEAKVSLVDRYTCMSPKRLFECPEKQILREHITKLKRRHQLEVKALKNKIKRRDQKIMELETILQTLNE